MKKFAVSLACLLVASTSACSFQAGFTTNKVKAADVQVKVATEIKAQTGYEADVSCPGDLAGHTGAKLTCTASVNGKSYPVNVSVTKVEDGNISYSWKLDNSSDQAPAQNGNPTPSEMPSADASPNAQSSSAIKKVNPEELKSELARVTKAETGLDAGVSCDPSGLDARVGATTTCYVSVSKETITREYEILVTEFDGKDVTFKYTRRV